MDKPVRVVCCGTGTAGAAVVKEALRLPWIDVAAVVVYQEEKEGKDAGEIVGLPPAGIAATRDFDSIVAMDDVDVVLYCAQEIDDKSNDEPIIRLLESGKNVVSPLAYHLTEIRTDGINERIEAACEQGGVSFHASGLNPGYVQERVAVLVSGMCHDIEHIKIEEFFDTSRASEFMAKVMGYGQTKEHAVDTSYVRQMADLYIRQPVTLTCRRLGVEIEKIEPGEDYFETPAEIDNGSYSLPANSVAGMINRWTAYHQGKPFLTYEANWYMGETMKPIESDTQDSWRITIEGRPSVQMHMEVMASAETGALMYDGDDTTPGWYAVAIPVVQAIPLVLDAEPGIVLPPDVGPHWTFQRGTTA